MPLYKLAAMALKLLLLSWLLSGCGRKGPLFIQQEPGKPVPVTAVPAEEKPLDTISPIHSQPAQTQTQTQPQK